MIEKIGKYFVLLEAAVLLFIGILDDVDIPLASIYMVINKVNLLLIPLMLLSKNKKRLGRGKWMLGTTALWIFYMMTTAMIMWTSKYGIQEALTNWCTPMLLCLACLVFLDGEDVKKLFLLFKTWYVLNFLLVLAEFFFFDKQDDMLGGFFGCYLGSNRETNIAHCIMLAAALCEGYASRKVKPFTLFVIAASAVMGALQCLKVFYFEYVIIILGITLCFAVMKQLDRKTALVTLGVALVSFLVSLLIIRMVLPGDFAVLTGTKSYEQYETNSRYPYAISRMHFIEEMNELWFHGSLKANLFGYGFGSGESSAPFFAEYGDLNYIYFAHQTLFLEGGFVGLILYIMIFLVQSLTHVVLGLRRRIPLPVAAFGAVYAGILAINVIYNNAFFSYAANMIWISMAIPLVLSAEQEDCFLH